MWVDKNTYEKDRKDPTLIGRDWWYVVKRKAGANLAIEEIKATKSKSQMEEARSRLVLSGGCTIGTPSDCPVDGAYKGLETVTCEYITTGSPWIHVYPTRQENITVSINPTGGLHMCNQHLLHIIKAHGHLPGTLMALWPLQMAYQKQVSTGNTIDILWFTPIVLCSKAQDPGFFVPTSQLKPFVAELALRIGFNAVETTSYLNSIDKAIPSQILTQRLPLYLRDFLNQFSHFPSNLNPHISIVYFGYSASYISPECTNSSCSTRCQRWRYCRWNGRYLPLLVNWWTLTRMTESPLLFHTDSNDFTHFTSSPKVINVYICQSTLYIHWLSLSLLALCLYLQRPSEHKTPALQQPKALNVTKLPGHALRSLI